MAQSLHDDGWRQGSLINESFDVHFLDVGEDGLIVDCTERHDLWMLVTQDCDLDSTKINNKTRQLELRPVYPKIANDKDKDIEGWRTRNVLVKNGLVLRADCPKLTLTASALQALKDRRDNEVDEDRRVQIKTWLGLRYDRPAIPKPFVDIGRAVESAVLLDMPESFRGIIRDAWIYFEEIAGEIRLFVILGEAHEERKQDVLDWLDDDVLPHLESLKIFVRERQAATSRGTSLWILQTYFGLDKTDLSLSG